MRAGLGLPVCLSSAPSTKPGAEHRVNMWMSVFGEGWKCVFAAHSTPTAAALLTQRADITPFPREGAPSQLSFPPTAPLREIREADKVPTASVWETKVREVTAQSCNHRQVLLKGLPWWALLTGRSKEVQRG